MGNVLTDGNGNVLLSNNNAFEVTSAIDSNIQAGNIKKDVTILGVTGTYEGSGGGGGDWQVVITIPEVIDDNNGVVSYTETIDGCWNTIVDAVANNNDVVLRCQLYYDGNTYNMDLRLTYYDSDRAAFLGLFYEIGSVIVGDVDTSDYCMIYNQG